MKNRTTLMMVLTLSASSVFAQTLLERAKKFNQKYTDGTANNATQAAIQALVAFTNETRHNTTTLEQVATEQMTGLEQVDQKVDQFANATAAVLKK